MKKNRFLSPWIKLGLCNLLAVSFLGCACSQKTSSAETQKPASGVATTVAPAPVASGVRIAVLNPQRVTRETIEGQRAQQVLQAFAQTRQDELVARKTEWEKQAELLSGQQNAIAPNVFKRRAVELQEKQARIQEAAARTERDILEKNQILLKPLTDKMQKILDEMHAKGKFDIVLPSEFVIYPGSNQNAGLDITNEVILLINQTAPAASASVAPAPMPPSTPAPVSVAPAFVPPSTPIPEITPPPAKASAATQKAKAKKKK